MSYTFIRHPHKNLYVCKYNFTLYVTFAVVDVSF